MKDIIENIINSASRHVGDEFLKSIYTLSLLSPGIYNVEEPIHIHLYGSPEVGKTNLQSIFMDLVANEHKDVASDFTPRVLMRSNLQPGTIISMNDKIFTDPVCTLLNQVCDSTSWRKGRVCATLVGGERVDLVFPPRVIFWMNSNKKVSDYSIREVDPLAIEGRFVVYEKTYSNDQKKNIFIKRNVYKEENNKNKIEEIREYINDIYNNPKTVNCSEECRKLIWEKSVDIGITSIRSIGRNLTMCQVMALTDNRTEVSINDINYIFDLLKSKEISFPKPKIDTTIIEIPNIKEIKDILIQEIPFKGLTDDKKICYSIKELQKKSNIPNITQILNNMEEKKIIGKENIRHVFERCMVDCYYIV